VKSRRLQWAKHLDRKWKEEMHTKFLRGILLEYRHSEHCEGYCDDSLGRRLLGWEVDGTGSRLCSVVEFGISGVDTLGSTTRS
jgi:hypothetical protein